MCAGRRLGSRCQCESAYVLHYENQCLLSELTFAVTPRVPYDLAQKCLMSMPFESARALAFLDEARKYLQFQSTVDILKCTEMILQMFRSR